MHVSCLHRWLSDAGAVQVVVGKKLDDVFMVMEFMEHDLKGLMEERDSSNPLFAMSEVIVLSLSSL